MFVMYCTPTLIKSDDLSPPTSKSHEKNDLVNVEVSTTSIIKPELASLLIYKAEKDLSSAKQQADENVKNAPTLIGNLYFNLHFIISQIWPLTVTTMYCNLMWEISLLIYLLLNKPVTTMSCDSRSFATIRIPKYEVSALVNSAKAPTCFLNSM
ncbi:unnamed protein product [Rhizophagus irregularis]|nr:unnamed protein product [Rhizophagus irregularis]